MRQESRKRSSLPRARGEWRTRHPGGAGAVRPPSLVGGATGGAAPAHLRAPPPPAPSSAGCSSGPLRHSVLLWMKEHFSSIDAGVRLSGFAVGLGPAGSPCWYGHCHSCCSCQKIGRCFRPADGCFGRCNGWASCWPATYVGTVAGRRQPLPLHLSLLLLLFLLCLCLCLCLLFRSCRFQPNPPGCRHPGQRYPRPAVLSCQCDHRHRDDHRHCGCVVRGCQSDATALMTLAQQWESWFVLGQKLRWRVDLAVALT